MSTHFDEPVERRNSGSLKWDLFRGKDILPFWVADMDFKSPPEVAEALHRRIDHGVFGYTLPGDGVIRETLAYLERTHGINADPSWLVWTPGLVPALHMAARLAGEPGDHLMTNTPVYPPFLVAHKNAWMTLDDVPLQNTGTDSRPRYEFDIEAMESAVSARTKLFILCNPHNPTGRVYSRSDLDTIVAFCERHDLILCSDEVHCDLILEPETHTHVSAAAFDGPIREKTITLMAASKTYNIPGLGCAYAVIPHAPLRRRFIHQLSAHGGFISEPNALGYHGTEAAYRHGEPWRRDLIRYLRENRDILIRFVREYLPPVHVGDVEATYLAWLDVRELGLDSPRAHFESHGIGLSDGIPFHAPGFVRFNFGCRRETLVEGLERLRRAVDAAKEHAP